MMNLNRVTLTGNVTQKPDLRQAYNGTPVLTLRLVVSGWTKTDGEWVEKPNVFDVTTVGATAENAAKYLAVGRPVAVDGRLDWSEWTTDAGEKRQRVQVIADQVQFLWPRPAEKPEPAEPAPAWFRTATARPEATNPDEIPF